MFFSLNMNIAIFTILKETWGQWATSHIWRQLQSINTLCKAMIIKFLREKFNFLAHPSWKLKWAFQIVFRLSVCKLDIFILSSRTTGPISTEYDLKHPWVKGILHFSNNGLRPYPRGVNLEIVKINWQFLKLLPVALVQFQPNLAQSILGWKVFQLSNLAQSILGWRGLIVIKYVPSN